MSDSKDAQSSTGAVRSSDTAKYSFTSLPMIGLLALARTAGEGAEKYGRFNYLRGLPIHETLDHVFRHLVMYCAGDRSEAHLAHAAWGLLNAIQEGVLRPEANVEHMLGPGCSITPAMSEYMDKMKPALAERRDKPDPDAFTWNIFDLTDVQKLRAQHDAVESTKASIAQDRERLASALTAATNYTKPQDTGNPTVNAFLAAHPFERPISGYAAAHGCRSAQDSAAAAGEDDLAESLGRRAAKYDAIALDEYTAARRDKSAASDDGRTPAGREYDNKVRLDGPVGHAVAAAGIYSDPTLYCDSHGRTYVRRMDADGNIVPIYVD